MFTLQHARVSAPRSARPRYNPAMPPTEAPSAGPWTTRKLLAWTTRFFERKQVDSPRLAAEMLLAHVLGVERLRLYMEADRPASEAELAAYRGLVERAGGHEPVDYLVGWTPFFTMALKVTPEVLVPRPSTETVVEYILEHARQTPGFQQPHIADVGTGSGAIAIALATHLPQSTLIATDISPAALAVARENADSLGVAGRIDFREGDLLEPLAGEQLDYLASNPPYISDGEWSDVPPNVRDHEPQHALRGGADGLDFIRPIIAGAPALLRPGGQLVLEIAAAHKDTAPHLAQEANLISPRILPDHEQLPRVLVAERPHERSGAAG